jgi:hypothetical protein
MTVSGAALLLALAGPLGPAAAVPDAPAAVITVVNGEVADQKNNKCSLIEAILNARATDAGQLRSDCAPGDLNGPDIVVLPANGEFVLSAERNTNLGPTGLPAITSAVTIEGNGATIRRSDTSGTPAFRILAVSPTGDLTLNNTTITGGRAPEHYYGGGIISAGKLAMAHSVVSNNVAWGIGGGIAAIGQSTLTISDSVLSGNGLWGSYMTYGGGLHIGPDAQATITGSHIVGNEVGSYWSAAGGGISVEGRAVITACTISGNVNGGSEGSGHGGGISVHHYGEAIITGSTIANNIVDPYFEGFSYEWHFGLGGGLSNHGRTMIANTTISGNQASVGGGVSNSVYGQLTIVHSTISGNEAKLITDETDGQTFELAGFGGGIFSGLDYRDGNCSATTLQGTVIAGNVAGSNEDEPGEAIYFKETMSGGENCSPGFTVDDFNLFGQDGAAGLVGLTPGATDIVPSVGLAAILGPLADNGGPTLTHALPAGSPALDLAPNAACLTEPVNGIDQRGAPRNRNGIGDVTANECDAGSFELVWDASVYLPVLLP